MHSGIFKVCLVVVTAIVNHPLLFPNNDTSVPANDDLIVQKLREREEILKKQQLELEELLFREQEPAGDAKTESEEPEGGARWDLWSTVSMVIFLMIEVWRQDFKDNSHEQSKEEEDLVFIGNHCHGVTLPNKPMLTIFHDQYIRATTHDAVRSREFVEGFADDLLEALRSVCNRDTDMEVEDSICVGSMYENWRVNKPLICDLLVPFAPPEPYHFRCQPWVSDPSIRPDRQSFGTILVCGPDDNPSGCVCDKKRLGEDMLCLLHNLTTNDKKVNEEINLLCCKNSNYLDVDQVMKWFQTTVTKAWSKISHKYEFEVTFSNLDSPGALRVKFKSGKVISLNVTPVVRYEDSNLYFISHFPSMPREVSCSIQWMLSFAVYERSFLKDFAKKLPDNSCHLSCLQIMTFLRSKQCHITGPSGLTTYHLKTVLMHLLLSQPCSGWANVMLEERLRDMFRSLEKSLLEKKLLHFMVGNWKLPDTVNLPQHFRVAEPVNLFRSFVLNRDLYQQTLSMFYEMLKNATVMINEYSLHLPNGSASKPAH
ncbi:hypothetical protein GDO78_018186 [Eleutherodactylus coqui]|uniref:Inositol 1,4,5-trisphosphate receptor-interacting protein n=1 Tax=Eleutherodactylus coqui TaxID=57060 RepID=A0A8J6B5J5_ELECQ|nr:hypothetical protein GDO78_018186 [Eleutherodactylus coqui]